MNILVNVINQKLKIKANTKRLVSGTQKFIRFEFSLDDAWDDLLVFAQFIQNGKAYNDYLDENNSVYLPPEIVDGKFNVLLYGSGSNVIATTNYLTFEVDKNMLISDAQSTEITESLYNKLVNIVKSYASQSASGAPTLASSSSLMTNPKTIYLYTGSEDNYIKGDWYYFLDGQLQHGGTYGAGVADSVPTQGSTNAVSSGGVYDALHDTDTTLSQSGQAADAEVTGELKDDNPNLFFASNTISRLMYGVTISFDNDGCITFDGTATGKLRYTIRGAVTTSDISLPAGTYVFSRELISGTASKNPFFATNDAGVSVDTEITLAEDTAVYIQINSGYTLSNAKYRFGIRNAGFTANDKTARSLVKKKSIKILGIGNSYTRDSLRWLSGILIKSGYDNVIVGHGYIGSITLAEQYASLDSSNANHSAYTYYKYINNDHQYTKGGKTLAEVITSELWDVVIFQQQSDEAGQYSSFVSSNFDINDFVSYVKTAIGNDNLKIGIALTWSHAHGYTGEKFVQYYGGDPTVQYDAIKQTIPQVANHMSQCDFIVNVGDAVEYGRDNTYLSTLGTELLRTDKNHLYYGIPSYMAGMVYAMTICGVNGTESTWYPTAEDEGVSGVVTSNNYARIARQCAKKAVMEVI